VLHEDLDDGFGVSDEVIGVELEFLKLGVLADEVFDRTFEGFDDFGELRGIGRSFDVENDFVINSQFLGDRQGVLRRASTFEVVNGDFGHGGEVAAEGEWSTGQPEWLPLWFGGLGNNLGDGVGAFDSY